jgi:endonuclease-3
VAEDEQRTVVAVTPDTSKVKRKSKKVKIDSSEKNKVTTRKKTTTTATTTATTTVTTTIQVLPPHVGTAKPPHGWEDIYTLVQELRSDRTAPCDFEGGEALPEPGLIETDPKTHRFQILIALMLSSQTKDATVGQAMRNLQKHGLTVENLLQTSHEDLDRLIQKVGFHNNKTKYIKQVVQILRDEYDDDIPPTAAEMIEKLPGVGPKVRLIPVAPSFTRSLARCSFLCRPLTFILSLFVCEDGVHY